METEHREPHFGSLGFCQCQCSACVAERNGVPDCICPDCRCREHRRGDR